MQNTQLASQINQLPLHLQQEIETFVTFLLYKEAQEKKPLPKRKAGFAKGKIRMSADFDAPIELSYSNPVG